MIVMRFLRKLEKTLYFILNLYALFNLQVFLLGFYIPERDLNCNYTRITILTLILYHLIRALRLGINPNKIRDLLPDLFFISIGLAISDSQRVFQFYLLGRQSFLMIKNLALSDYRKKNSDHLLNNPPVFVLFSFFLAIFVGTLMLLLPSATAAGKVTTFIGALFTSTSATCVTGLIVYDTGTHFTIFGQMVILTLIQVGGLGIMTVSSAFAVMLGQRMTLKSESLIQNVVGEQTRFDMVRLLRNVIIVTFIFEFFGAAILYGTFHKTFVSSSQALYYSVFHSISSFCNAGFSLFQSNFMQFRQNLNINFIVPTLIILGGIGFPVMVDLKENLFRKFNLSRLSLHSKIVLATTLILLVSGFIGYFITEYSSEMKGFALHDRILSSWFQSVTTRTAGFNTINTANFGKSSVLISIVLMFIGASPGSTGGGIKTTAFAVIVLSVLAMFKGNRDVNVYKRRIGEDIMKKVMALITASLALLSFMIFMLLILEPFSFQQTIFEAFSAFGTVGLSMGITPHLSSLGKLIIILLMYLGRVGPLTLIFAISETKARTNFKYIEEKVSIG